MEHRAIKYVTTERRRNYLVSAPTYDTIKFFTENVLATELRKTQILINKPVYLGLPIFDLCKTVMHEYSFNYVEPKYGENAKFCYMDIEV